MVADSQVAELNALYAHSAQEMIAQSGKDSAFVLSQSILDFLSSEGWRENILQARKQLNKLADDGILVLLSEMFVNGQAETIATSICGIQEHLDQNMFFTALEECYWAIQQDPYFLPLHLLMANVLIAKGQLTDAVSKYTVTAETYQARGENQRSIAVYDRALQVAPMNVEARERLVNILLEAGMIDRAIEQLIAAADSYYQLAQIDRAIEKLDEALSHAGQGDPSRRWQSNILHRIGDINVQRLDWRQAIRDYRRIKRSDPQDTKARTCLVDLYLKSSQREMALKELDELIDVYRGRRQPQELLSILTETVQAWPDEIGLRMRLAKMYLDLRRRADAIDELNKIGELQLERGQPQEAIRTVQAIIRLGPDNVEGYRQLLDQLRSR
jgi:tetratricopeptide (TPR) repeat protein